MKSASKRTPYYLATGIIYAVYFGVMAFAREYTRCFVLALGVAVFGVTGTRYWLAKGAQWELLAGAYILLSSVMLFFFWELGWIWIVVTFSLMMVLVPLYLAITRRA
jgi:hypothetical protein